MKNLVALLLCLFLTGCDTFQTKKQMAKDSRAAFLMEVKRQVYRTGVIYGGHEYCFLTVGHTAQDILWVRKYFTSKGYDVYFLNPETGAYTTLCINWEEK